MVSSGSSLAANKTTDRRSILGSLGTNASWVLVVATVALLCTQTLYNIPLGIMSVLGLIHVARRPAVLLRERSLRCLSLLFLAIWVPMLIALPDAVNSARSSRTVFLYLHFFFAAVYIAQALARPGVANKVVTGVFVISAIWVADALLQVFAGQNIFGYPYIEGRFTGMFYPNYRLGHILAVFAPLCFEFLRRAQSRWYWLFIPALFVVVFLGGRRTAWLLLFFSSFAYLGCLFLRYRWEGIRSAILPAIAVVVLLTATSVFYGGLAERVERTARLFSTEYEDLDYATSFRATLWVTGFDMFKAHWINGVGPRSYRYAYRDFARKGDYLIGLGISGGTHPHWHLLEVMVETGIIGLAGYIGFFLMLLQIHRRSANRPFSDAWRVAALAAVLPINAHLAFFGSYWATVIWLMLSIAVAISVNDDIESTSSNVAQNKV